jgi:SAM-dependent methyltransferase
MAQDGEFADFYVQLLRRAVRNPMVWQFSISRLSASLGSIGIDKSCVTDIISLLQAIDAPQDSSAPSLAGKIASFQSDWRPHLDRAYFIKYEKIRWSFFLQHVLDRIDPSKQFGRCLDLGCGRGCLTAGLRQCGATSDIVGVDQAHFQSEWRERKFAAKLIGLDFQHVSVADFAQWFCTQSSFDTIFLNYVLHHSNQYWATQTLSDLRRGMKATTRIVVLEDTYFRKLAPLTDPFHLNDLWRDLADQAGPYRATSGFHIQALLDFVAVQLLANFREVDMPCNYERGEEWEAHFVALGFKVLQREYVGFPPDRDIDVPQGYFVLGI